VDKIDTYAFTNVEHRKESLRQQREALQVSLDQVSAQLNTVTQECELCMKRWQSDILYYKCKWYYTCKQAEEASEDDMSNIQYFTNRRCGGCGDQTRVKIHRDDNAHPRDIWLICAASIPCGYRQHIVTQRN